MIPDRRREMVMMIGRRVNPGVFARYCDARSTAIRIIAEEPCKPEMTHSSVFREADYSYYN